MSSEENLSSATTTECAIQAPGRRLLLGGGAFAVFLALVHTVSDALYTMPSTLLPTLQQRFSLSEGVLALLVATLWLSSSLAQPVFGAFGDRLDRRVVISLGVVANSVLLSLVGVVPAVWLLFAVLFFGGLGMAALHPVGADVAREVGGERKTLAVGLFASGGELGFAVGPVVILFVVSVLGVEGTPLLMLPGLVLAALAYRFVPEQPAQADRSSRRLLDLGLLRGPIGLLTLSGVLSAVPFITFMSATPLWLVRDHGFPTDSPLIGLTLAAFAIGGAAGAVLIGALAVRVGVRILLSGSMLAAVFPLLGMLWLEPGTLSFLAAVAVAGALVFANVPLLVIVAQEEAPNARASASGFVMGFTTAIAGVAYVGVGALQETVGLGTAMAASYVLMVPAALVALAAVRRPAPDLASGRGS